MSWTGSRRDQAGVRHRRVHHSGLRSLRLRGAHRAVRARRRAALRHLRPADGACKSACDDIQAWGWYIARQVVDQRAAVHYH